MPGLNYKECTWYALVADYNLPYYLFCDQSDDSFSSIVIILDSDRRWFFVFFFTFETNRVYTYVFHFFFFLLFIFILFILLMIITARRELSTIKWFLPYDQVSIYCSHYFFLLFYFFFFYSIIYICGHVSHGILFDKIEISV